jgi:alkyl sulfatase BDS1-like metallo-beta-lactamase superfamily hydrolase
MARTPDGEPGAVDICKARVVRSIPYGQRLIQERETGGNMAETTVKGFFDALEGKLGAKPSMIAGMDCVYQFKVGESSYNVKLKDGKATVSAGETPSPNCTLTMAEGDFLDMVSGRLNGQMAFLTGKLKVAGDMGLALKLGSFLG